jgi:hypothetical protein
VWIAADQLAGRFQRCQVAYANQRGLSVRRACALMSVARSTLCYESRLIERDEPTIVVMREFDALNIFLPERGERADPAAT